MSTSSTLPDLKNYIGSEFSSPIVSLGRDTCDANTSKPLQAQFGADPEQVEAALAVAQACYQNTDWERDIQARIEVLDKMADYLAQPEIVEQIAQADALTTGVVIGATRKLTAMFPFLFSGAADILRAGKLSETLGGKRGDVTHFRRPWGPSLLISPWNGPTPIGAHKLASAIAAGAPALVKPSVWTPHSAIIMAEAAHHSGAPKGSVNLIMGDRMSAKPMLDDARVKAISFTGGLGGGQAIAHACADDFKPTQLELGGNNALVVLEGADLDAAVEGIVFGLANLNGQWCRALGRVIVHESLKTKLLDKTLERLSTLKLGSSMDDQSEMGPQAHQRQFDDVQKAIDTLCCQGGKALSETPKPDPPGYFVAPTIIDGCKPEDTLHEVFGPVAALHTFSTESEALKLSNDPPYGLAGYVYGRDEHALAFANEMRTGGVKVNGYSLLALRGDLPRGAWGLSGLGEEGGWESIRFLTGARVVGLSPQDKLGG